MKYFKDGLFMIKDQEEALKDPEASLWLAYLTHGVDIKRCEEVACRDPGQAYWFARLIHEANIKKCVEACRGTEYEDKLNTYLMEKALI